MLLATSLLIEFGRFLQVLTWIMLPILLLSVIITTWHHYRKKKKKEEDIINQSDSLLDLPAEYGDTGGKKGAYLLFDHSGLIRQYQHKLSYNEARYAALKHDFEKLELKYTSATGLAATRNANENNTQMENTIQQMQERMYEQSREYNAEKAEFMARLDQLDRSYKDLEMENQTLLEHIEIQAATREEKEIMFNSWKEENNILKEQVAAQQQTALTDPEILIWEKQKQSEIIPMLQHTQNDQLLYTESVLREAKQQNEMLNAYVADSQDKIDFLQGQLEFEQGRVRALEQKLQANRKMLRRLYKEFSACLDEENPGSPVVSLRTSYANDMD